MDDSAETPPLRDEDPFIERTAFDGRWGTIAYFNWERGPNGIERIPAPRSRARCYELRFDDGSGEWGDLTHPIPESPRKARSRRLAERGRGKS